MTPFTWPNVRAVWVPRLWGAGLGLGLVLSAYLIAGAAA